MSAIIFWLFLVLFSLLDSITAGPINLSTSVDDNGDDAASLQLPRLANDETPAGVIRSPRGIEVDCNNKEIMEFLMESQAAFRCVSRGFHPQAPAPKNPTAQSTESRCGPYQFYMSEVGICVPSRNRKRSSGGANV